MTCPPPPTQRNHKVWRSAPDAILPGHRRHPSGSRHGHPRYTGAVTTGSHGWPNTNDTNVKSRCNDASSKHSKTPVLRKTSTEEGRGWPDVTSTKTTNDNRRQDTDKRQDKRACNDQVMTHTHLCSYMVVEPVRRNRRSTESCQTP